MAWQLTTYTLVGFVAAASSGLVAAVAWRSRGHPGARPFTALMLALGGWSLVYAVQIGSTTAAAQLPAQRVALAIGGTIPTLWLVFTLRYARKAEWLTRRRLALLAVDPVAFGLLTLSNDLHGLIWSDAALLPGGPPVVTLTLAVGYYAHIVYGYLAITAGLAILALVSAGTPSLYRRQTALLIFGTLPPFLGNVAFTARLEWGPLPALDPTPFAFVVTGLLFGLALYRFDLLDRTPIARRLVFEEMGDGLVVLDAEGTIVDLNGVADQLLGPEGRVGGDAAAVTAAVDEPPTDGLEDIDGTTTTATVDGRERAYDVRTAALTDSRGETTGWVVGFRDVTERNRYQQRLKVAQRVLRHNLRNDMNVIRGLGEILEEQADGESEEARQLVAKADGLIDLSEKTRTMVDIAEYAGTDPIEVDVRRSLRAVVDEVERRWPAARIETDIPRTAVRLPHHELLTVGARNLVENAIEHNDRAEPWVSVSAERRAGDLLVRVADDGPGIPEMEREVLREGRETPLKHGQGIGLWLTYWSVMAAGGDIRFRQRSPRGSVVTLRYPVHGEPTETTESSVQPQAPAADGGEL